MSSSAVNAIFDLTRVTSAEKFILVFIASKLGRKSVAWPNQASIATHTSLSKSTVIRSLKDLERDGYIERTRRNRPDGSRSSDIYSLPCAREGFAELRVSFANQGVTTKPRLQVFDGDDPENPRCHHAA